MLNKKKRYNLPLVLFATLVVSFVGMIPVEKVVEKSDNFDIVLDGRSFDFMTLSDGYSSVLNIVIEIMMRMENKSAKNYNIQGIVFIDEIETHLHIDLQKKILPFLISFFPKIQFIVTTHSPFVLTSIDNTVVFDLEKQIKLENLSGYSYLPLS